MRCTRCPADSRRSGVALVEYVLLLALGVVILAGMMLELRAWIRDYTQGALAAVAAVGDS